MKRHVYGFLVLLGMAALVGVLSQHGCAHGGSSTGGTYVKSYTRSNGTTVRAHYRSH